MGRLVIASVLPRNRTAILRIVHEGAEAVFLCKAKPESILNEARQLTAYPDFKGYILDVGGPTANMYGFECEKKIRQGACSEKHCLYPKVCPSLKANHRHHLEVLRKVRNIKGVKKVFVASGIRYDLLLSDKQSGKEYLHEVVEHHVSGQMKVAPEHTETHILNLMGSPGQPSFCSSVKSSSRRQVTCGAQGRRKRR
jgi:uncharacterized radical SAM protein YgiQ